MKNKNTLTNDKNRLILALKTVAVNNSITQEAIAVKTGLNSQIFRGFSLSTIRRVCKRLF